MARNRRGRMALYEVMSKAKEKPGYRRTLENIRTGKGGGEEPSAEKEEAVVAETVETDTGLVSDETIASEGQGDAGTSGVSVQWRRKPRVVQYNKGRIEFSVPYQIGIATVLGLVVVMLLAFRVGQRSVVIEKAGGNIPPVNVGRNRQDLVAGGNKGVREGTPATKGTVQDSVNVGAAATGNQVIVLVEYGSRRDLVPVQEYFANNGIATEIVLSGGQYFLLTKDRYSYRSLLKGSGGKGDLAKQKIAEVGKKYKAPQGYETFAKHLFSDAYGMKVD